MDVATHFKFAQTSKSMLRFYLLGNNQSFYSREMIQSYRPLAAILFGMYDYYSEKQQSVFTY
jgi:hypothetical protein